MSSRLSSEPAFPRPDRLSISTSLDSAGDLDPSNLGCRPLGLSIEFELSGVAGGESVFFNDCTVGLGFALKFAFIRPEDSGTLANGISSLEEELRSSRDVFILEGEESLVPE